MSAQEDALGPMQRDMLGELRRRYDAGTAGAGLAALREEIAHELAEKIRRAYSGDEPDHSWVNNPYDAADLIDPDTP